MSIGEIFVYVCTFLHINMHTYILYIQVALFQIQCCIIISRKDDMKNILELNFMNAVQLDFKTRQLIVVFQKSACYNLIISYNICLYILYRTIITDLHHHHLSLYSKIIYVITSIHTCI